MAQQHDLIVIGSGPGGYVAAIRAAQLGWNVACVEKEPRLGGTCLRVGCIPSKALLESSERYWQAKEEFSRHGIQFDGVKLDLPALLKRKDEIVAGLTGGVDLLFKKNKITRYVGHGRLDGRSDSSTADAPLYRVMVQAADGKGERTVLEAGHILIATGSKVASLRGVAFDSDRIGTSTEALAYSEVPEHLVVIGAGYIGLELGSVWKRLGAKVTVLEYLPRILPGMDAEIADLALKVFKKQGLEFQLGCKVTGARVETGAKKADGKNEGGKSGKGGGNQEGKNSDSAACIVECEGLGPICCDRVLVAVGRIPNTDNLGLDSVGLQIDERGRVPIDDHFATPVSGIYAIGDVVRGPMLAHKAEEEGVACVERIITGYGHVDYNAIPGVVYTEPEIATVGKTEEELKQAEIPYRKGVFAFKANARARCLDQTEGRVKMLAHAETDRILGVHILGPRAGDLIAEAATAIAFGASSEDVARACHAHPTLAEAVKEAALAVDNRTIHS